MLNEGAREHPASNIAAAEPAEIAGVLIIPFMELDSMLTLGHLRVE